MQTTTKSPVTNSTAPTTKSREEILIQSSGAMIAVIIIGIIFILSILLIILKTYNKKMHTKRMLGGISKPRKNTTSTTTMTTLQMENLRSSSRLAGLAHLPHTLENGFRLPRAELSSTAEQSSMTNGSTVVTVHDVPSIENT